MVSGSWDYRGTRVIDGVGEPPRPDNDNWRLMEEWMTPAELMQWIRRTRDEMRRELAGDDSLWHCPRHRRQRLSLDAMERCALWHYWGVR